MIKVLLVVILFTSQTVLFSQTQNPAWEDHQRKNIYALIDQYSLARENRDTILLKNILTPDIDQLVSTGEWRNGVNSSVQGMLNSSSSNPGTRRLTIEKIRFLNQNSALVDCKYIIQNTNSTLRSMWSTFIVVREKDIWKISAIRNMLPSAN